MIYVDSTGIVTKIFSSADKIISISTLVAEMALSIETRLVKYIKARENTGIYT